MTQKHYVIGIGSSVIVIGLVIGGFLGYNATKGKIALAETPAQTPQESLPPLAERVLTIRHDRVSADTLQKLIASRQNDADIQEVTLSDGTKATIIIPHDRTGEVTVDSVVSGLNKNITEASTKLQDREKQLGRSETERQVAIQKLKDFFGVSEVTYKLALPPEAFPKQVVTELYVDNYGYQYVVDPRTNNPLRRELQHNGSFRTTHPQLFNEKGEYKEIKVTAEQARSIAENFLKKAGAIAEVIKNLRLEEGKGGAYVFLYGEDGQGLEQRQGSFPIELVVEPVTGEIIRYSNALNF